MNNLPDPEDPAAVAVQRGARAAVQYGDSHLAPEEEARSVARSVDESLETHTDWAVWLHALELLLAGRTAHC